MRRDLVSVLIDLGQHLGRPLSRETAESLKAKVTLKGMRETSLFGTQGEDPFKTKFFRKGVVGDWKGQDMDVAQFDEWIANSIKGTDIEIKYD